MPEEAPSPCSKVCVVGFTSSLHLAPWGDPEWEVIGTNNLHKQIPELWPKATAWQNLHKWPDIACDPEHVAWLQEVPFPVWLFPETIAAAERDGIVFPTAVPFPVEEILEAAEGMAGARYFTNSIAWMVALAVLRLQDVEGAELALFGIDLAQDTEYRYERPCVEYWLGVAEALGITVTIPAQADILKSAGLYGVDHGVDALAAKMRVRIDELEVKLGEANAQWEALRSQMETTRYMQYQIAGALEDCRYWMSNWVQQPGNVREGGADKYSTEAVEPEAPGA